MGSTAPRPPVAASIESDGPADAVDSGLPLELDDETLVELDPDYWDALAPEDDYEPLPEPGDFWTEED